MPKIAKRMNVNPKNTRTPNKPGSEANKASISCFILGRRLIVLSGRRILNVLNDFKPPLLTLGKKLSTEMITTKKSSQFHASLKYENLWKMKPFAIILQAHSRMKTIVNARSSFSS
jgi:hypothetical protein